MSIAVTLMPDDLRIIRYALDQQIVTLNGILADKSAIDERGMDDLKTQFKDYVVLMQAVLDDLPEV